MRALLSKWKKYISFFRLRFAMGLQYRTAAFAGIATQFVWGFMEINVFYAFRGADPAAFPMGFHQLASYIWMQQAFLALFMTWFMENEIFDSIVDGNICYELCRPIDIYDMWFARSVANRTSRALLRCMPILLVAFFLPRPYAMTLPPDALSFLCFLPAMLLGMTVTVALCMLVYMLSFFTVSPQGLRIIFAMTAEILQGIVIPLPFFPTRVQKVLELLPFASMENVPLRIYSGNISGGEAVRAMLLQVFWIAALIAAGKLICRRAMKKITLQGG